MEPGRMPLPTTRLALPDVGASEDQAPTAAARPDPQVRGLLRRRELNHRHSRAHVLRHLQCRYLPGLPQKAVAAPLDSKAHDHRSRQRPLSPRPLTGCVPAQIPPCVLIAVSAALQSLARLDREGLEIRATLGDAQPVLRHAHRAARSREPLLRCLAATQPSTEASMLHYLRRCV